MPRVDGRWRRGMQHILDGLPESEQAFAIPDDAWVAAPMMVVSRTSFA